MNGWYDNVLDDYIAADDIKGALKHIDWLVANKLPDPEAKNYNSLYISTSLLRKTIVPTILEYAFDRGVRFGIAFSDKSEIDQLITYNASQPNIETKFHFAITEMEPYNGSMTYAEMTAQMTYAKARLDAMCLPMRCYMGWPDPKYWETIVPLVDEINLHDYRPDKYMTQSALWSYISPRLGYIAAACQKANKKVRVNIIFSCEPSFAYKWFQTHKWRDAMKLVQDAWNKSATSAMKKWLDFGDMYMFVTKYGKQIKP